MPSLNRNQRGFTHHLLLFVMLLFVVGAAVIGARRIYLLHAQVNPTYVVAMNTQQGCTLTGRVWDSSTSDCTNNCRPNAGDFAHKVGSDGVSRGYCKAAVAETMTDNTCVNDLYRYYIKEIGCARRPNQDVNKDNAPQCQPAKPRYMATASPNVCVTPASTPPSFRVASFNLLGADHTTDPSDPRYQIGQYPSRLAAAYKVMTGQKFDVVGVQEMQDPQRTLFLANYGANWGIYPTTADYGPSSASLTSIVWNKARFSFVAGTYAQYQFKDSTALENYPVVQLKDLKTGNVVVFGNIHNPTESTPNAASIRYDNALRLRATAQSWINQGYPVVYTGDYNADSFIRVPQDSNFTGSNRNKLPYCAFGATGSMAHAYDLLLKRNKPDGTCPAANILIKIDQIVANTDSTVTNYNPFTSADVANATDHPYVPYADVIPEAAP